MLIVSVDTLMAVSIVQLPDPLPSKIALCPAVGGAVPPGPPDTVDQLTLLFQLLATFDTQYLFEPKFQFVLSPASTLVPSLACMVIPLDALES